MLYGLVLQSSKLINLNCNNNTLASLDILDCILLEYLDCSNNQLSSLNVTTNIGLEVLNCSENLLANLNISNNCGLGYLACDGNQIIELDISKMTYHDCWCWWDCDCQGSVSVQFMPSLKQLNFGYSFCRNDNEELNFKHVVDDYTLSISTSGSPNIEFIGTVDCSVTALPPQTFGTSPKI